MKTIIEKSEIRENKIVNLLCKNIIKERFNWCNYYIPKKYYGLLISIVPLHCSYGQIGYSVYFPFSQIPTIEYDWEKGKIEINGEEWHIYNKFDVKEQLKK